METQSSLLVERLQDGTASAPAAADSALSGLLQQLAAPAPLSGAQLESALKQRTQRFEGLLAKAVGALASSRSEQKTLLAAVQAGSDPEAARRAAALAEGDAARAEALSVKLQAEQAATASQLHTARDRLTVAEQARGELDERLELLPHLGDVAPLSQWCTSSPAGAKGARRAARDHARRAREEDKGA